MNKWNCPFYLLCTEKLENYFRTEPRTKTDEQSRERKMVPFGESQSGVSVVRGLWCKALTERCIEEQWWKSVAKSEIWRLPTQSAQLFRWSSKWIWMILSLISVPAWNSIMIWSTSFASTYAKLLTEFFLGRSPGRGYGDEVPRKLKRFADIVYWFWLQLKFDLQIEFGVSKWVTIPYRK